MPVNMKTFKINKNANKTVTTTKLDYSDGELKVSGDCLCLTIEREKVLEVTPSGKLHFEKFASGNSGELLKVCERDVKVLNITDEPNGKRHIYFEYPYIEPLTVSSFFIIEDTATTRYKFYFTQEHNMVPLPIDTTGVTPTDFDTYEEDASNTPYTIYVKRGNNIAYFSGLTLCYPNEFERGENIIKTGDGYCCGEYSILFNYETMERNSVLVDFSGMTNGSEELFKQPKNGDKVYFCTNPYFWTDINGVLHLYENVSLCKFTDFMGLNVVLEDDYDAKRMFQEYQVNEQFVEKIKNTIIPDFVDLEKIKYAPAFSGDSIYLATGLTFNLHFRSRVMDKSNDYKFEDTWHLDDTVNTWNGGDISKAVKMENLYNDQEFVNSSNLMGFLDFTDDDVYNQKNRVKQSFLRLSFYDSNNPLEQNLMYYSTIFLDSGDLFGKFIKRKAWLEETIDWYDESTYPVIWSSASTEDPVSAVTSQIIVNDEYDTTRSGEGFNLYLFKQDAPIEEDAENPEKDIYYMKVEFNHAGNGRTIPLIFWPKNGEGTPVKLSIGNYFKYLYIKVKIALTDKGYVYILNPDDVVEVDDTDPSTKKNGLLWENDRLIFNLFEPKIETEGDAIPNVETDTVTITGTFNQI